MTQPTPPSFDPEQPFNCSLGGQLLLWPCATWTAIERLLSEAEA